jgi:hypothetical protein
VQKYYHINFAQNARLYPLGYHVNCEKLPYYFLLVARISKKLIKKECQRTAILTPHKIPDYILLVAILSAKNCY